MQSEITRLNRDAAIGISYAHAPSLMSALRSDAELLATNVKLSGQRVAEMCLCKYTMGEVIARVFTFGQEVIVSFVNENTRKSFASVKVTFND